MARSSASATPNRNPDPHPTQTHTQPKPTPNLNPNPQAPSPKPRADAHAQVLGKRISDGSVVTGDRAISSRGAPAPGQVIATNTTLKPDGTTTAGPDGRSLACSTVLASDGRPLGRLLPDGDRPRHPFREFLAPVVRTRREKPSAASPHKRRSTIPSPFGTRRRLSKLHDHGESLDAAPLLAIKFEKVRSDAPAFLLPAAPGQLLVGLDGAGAVGWRNPDGSIVAPGPDDAGGAPGPFLARSSIVRPDGVVVHCDAPAGTRACADAEGLLLPVSVDRAEDRPEITSEIEISSETEIGSELSPQPFGEVRPG